MIKKSPDSELKHAERKALTVIRNRIVHFGAAPSLREIALELNVASPRSAMLVIDRLIDMARQSGRERRGNQDNKRQP